MKSKFLINFFFIIFGIGLKESNTAERVENYYVGPDKREITFNISNPNEKEYLWIMIYGCDKRKIEHGALPLRIEVNDNVIEKERSILQADFYKYPVHPYNWRITLSKYNKEKKTWSFKYDTDFIMNNGCGTPGNWGVYTTLNYNHWYVFDLKGIVKKDNKITIKEFLTPGYWKSKFYNGFFIGEITFCSLEEIKEKIKQYEEKQIKIPPEELSYENIVKKKFSQYLLFPKGEIQIFKVENGYLTKNDKPFFLSYLNCFSNFNGRENVLDIYNYYSLINASMAGAGTSTGRDILDLPIYLKDDWDKRKIELWEICNLLTQMNIGYQKGILTLPYILYTENYLPYLRENYPEIFAKSSDGTYPENESGQKFPNLSHPSFQEYISQVHTILARTFRNHPGLMGYSVWEEMGWRVSQPYGKLVPQSSEDLKRYQTYLKEKYGEINRLNNEWKTNYKNFEEIEFPIWRTQTANFVNFQIWRSQQTCKCAQIAYDVLKKEDPNHIIMGQKTYGDIGNGRGYWTHAIDNWLLTKYTDISREYPNTSFEHFGRSCTNFYNKVMEADICLGSSPYVEWGLKEGENYWNIYSLLDSEGLTVYPYFMNCLFNDVKGFHWEIYDLGHGIDFHFIHHTKLWKKENATFRGLKINFDKAGIADVIIPEKTLKIARLLQWAIRNASILLPAKVPQPEIVVLTSTFTRLLGYDIENKIDTKIKKMSKSWIDNSGQDFLLLGHLFDHLHLKFDCLEERNISDIFKYKVAIVGYQTNVGSIELADKIKEFVENGGTVIFYPEAFSFNSIDFKNLEESPGFGLSNLVCATIDNTKLVELKGIKITDNRFTPDFPIGSIITSNRFYGVQLRPKKGGIVLAVSENGYPVLVSDSKGKCFYFAGYLGLAYYESGLSDNFARLFENILIKNNVKKPVIIEGTKDRKRIIPGILKGENYYLLSLNNFNKEEENITVKPTILKPGYYDIIDISGEFPIITKGEDGNFHLMPDFKSASPKYVKKNFSAGLLKRYGFSISVPPYYSKVFILRPSDLNVFIHDTIPALNSYIKYRKPLKIVIGDNLSKREKELVEKIQEILSKKLNKKVEIVKDYEIKTKIIEGKLIEDNYELEKYTHEVIDDNNNLIIIGNEKTNKVIKHLQTPGKYSYCKVPEMISENYPGKGRGIIQIVECINTISYDPTDKGRDAILVSGSDEAGITNALRKFIDIIEKK